ncbi:MAG TPA: hypothetical protein VIK78_18220 [Ruminiclostridium sp.]
MMLFLSSHNNVNIFDWLNESSLVEQPFMLKKISSTQFDLSSFAKKEALSINYYKYLAIDLGAVINDADSFRIALHSIHIMNPKMRFIYVDIGNKSTELQEALKKYGEVPIISMIPEESIPEFKAQVKIGLNSTPMFHDNEREMPENKKHTNYLNRGGNLDVGKTEERDKTKKEFIFENKNVMIAVLNAYPRAGATTLSINMVVYLKSIGASAVWVECNDELDHLEKIRNNTSGFTTINENCFDRNGIIFMKNKMAEGMDFAISDLSRIIKDDSVKEELYFVAKCNTVVLCGTSKPYELQEIKEKIQLLSEYDCKICLCLSFTPEHEKAHLVDMFSSKTVSVFFTGYTPDMFNSSSNGEMFKRILQEYLKEKTNDNMLKLF